eukprot:11326116-Prorocentrum_lima.AAC.1
MTSSLVGSEMCIRDSTSAVWPSRRRVARTRSTSPPPPGQIHACFVDLYHCLLYTSDAADDM